MYESQSQPVFRGRDINSRETAIMGKDCIFCDIVNGKSDTELLYEDDTLVVFRDIQPHAPVHLLVVPRKHIRSINDLQQKPLC
jgi:galactose-1-phosphate uridylyltransferase